MENKPWYKKEKEPLKPPQTELEIPEGLMETCKKCKETIYKKELVENLWVCPKCDHHHRMPAHEWARILFDDGKYEEVDHPLYATDPLGFVDSKAYKDRLKASWEKTGNDDAVINVIGKIGGRRVIISIFDFYFMGGSMGSVVGEKLTRAAEYALSERIPYLTISCSGGARMQEGMYSLMQLVKTCYSCGKLREAGVPFLSILSDPSTAGVMASFASLGDLIIAEKGALIGFAGPRVIAQTIGGELPDGFQRPEFCQEHGMVDLIVHRSEMAEKLATIIGILCDSGTMK